MKSKYLLKFNRIRNANELNVRYYENKGLIFLKLLVKSSQFFPYFRRIVCTELDQNF